MALEMESAIVIRRFVDYENQLEGGQLALEMGQFGFARQDQTLVCRDTTGEFHYIKTGTAMLEQILSKPPVQTVAALPTNDATGTLRMVLDKNSYWFKTTSIWVEIPDKAYFEEIFNNEILRAARVEQTLADQIAAEASARGAADDALQGQIDDTNARIERVENMGDYVGSFPTFVLLPADTSAFPNGITVNDFTTIQSDETHSNTPSRYVVSAINGTAITWNYDFSYSQDITGKADKVAGATSGNFAGLDASGNLADSGKKASDFAATNQSLAATANTDNDTTTPAVASNTIANILQTIWNKIRSVANALASKIDALTAGTGITISGSGTNRTITNSAPNIQSDWNATTSATGQILNKPTIPTVNNATLTIQRNGISKGTFAANASTNATINVNETGFDTQVIQGDGSYRDKVSNTTGVKTDTLIHDLFNARRYGVSHPIPVLSCSTNIGLGKGYAGGLGYAFVRDVIDKWEDGSYYEAGSAIKRSSGDFVKIKYNRSTRQFNIQFYGTLSGNVTSSTAIITWSINNATLLNNNDNFGIIYGLGFMNPIHTQLNLQNNIIIRCPNSISSGTYVNGFVYGELA